MFKEEECLQSVEGLSSLGSLLNVSDKTLYLSLIAKSTDPPAPELCRQSFCLPMGTGRQSIYHTKTCWLSRKLSSKLLTPSSVLSPQGNTQSPSSSSPHLSPRGLFTHTPAKELGDRCQKKSCNIPQMSISWPNGICHQDVDFFKKTVSPL